MGRTGTGHAPGGVLIGRGRRMLALADVVQRIRDQVPAARIVAHGLEADVPARTPAVYVYPLAEDSEPPAALGPVIQRAVVRIASEIIVTAARSPRRGEGAADELEAVRGELMAALAGWQPAWADEPLEHRQGRLVQLEAGWASWRDEWETRVTRGI
ncbi:MAG: hypothetical protein KatS3mg119_1887 [Rhodothalassiaceae bacterium]|nr:MAG: hypothetical protein KatS3mg119_1887 [Rhodothalassiaceae bacterium]